MCFWFLAHIIADSAAGESSKGRNNPTEFHPYRWVIAFILKMYCNCIDFCLPARSLCVAQVQKPAPAFSGTAVVNNDFKDIKLDDFKGKYLVLFFYPLDL